MANGTTGKPAAGDEVVLLSLAGGMEEVAHATTDGKGSFVVNVPDENVPHLVRVVHQGVNYHKSAPPGTSSLDITVYDASREINNLIVEARVLRIQAVGDQLEVSESYTLRNESQPPRTLSGEQTLQVAVPEGARVLDGMVAGPGGMPTTNPPTPAQKKNYYTFNYPIRPGRAQFQITYKLNYSGSYEFNIAPEMSLAELGVLLPKSMKFNAASGFAQDSDEAGMAVYFSKSVKAGQTVKFTVSGEGAAPNVAQSTTGVRTAVPEGAIATHDGAPASPSNLRWYIIALMAVIVATGGFWLMHGSRVGVRQSHFMENEGFLNGDGTAKNRYNAFDATRPQESMLEAFKEELFQLESDRLRQAISQDEYDMQKAGLDMLLRRQMTKLANRQKSSLSNPS